MRFIVSCLVTVLCLGTIAAFAAAPEPTTDEQKTLYALGLAISQSLGAFSLSESELDLVKSGITDGVFKKAPQGRPPNVRSEDSTTTTDPRLGPCGS